MDVKIEPLTSDAFQGFGDVIETEGKDHFSINNGSTERYHDLARVEVGPNGRTLVNIFRATPLTYPLKVTMVERHPLASQAFIPLSGEPYLVLVAPKGAEVLPEKLRAFQAGSQQGVNYHPGTWHHPVLALNRESDFLVIDRGGEGDNCDEFYFDTEIWLRP
ncbi:MAG: ureidoglycolate lyase [Proteobacteria bacterium]|nr:ureidoglycolate lyase [Pseudomonadota bacterium]